MLVNTEYTNNYFHAACLLLIFLLITPLFVPMFEYLNCMIKIAIIIIKDFVVRLHFNSDGHDGIADIVHSVSKSSSSRV